MGRNARSGWTGPPESSPGITRGSSMSSSRRMESGPIASVSWFWTKPNAPSSWLSKGSGSTEITTVQFRGCNEKSRCQALFLSPTISTVTSSVLLGGMSPGIPPHRTQVSVESSALVSLKVIALMPSSMPRFNWLRPHKCQRAFAWVES